MIWFPKSLLSSGLSPSALKINLCMRTKGPNFNWKICDIVLSSGLSERTVRTELKNMIKLNLVVSRSAVAPISGNKINLYKCVYESRTTKAKTSKGRGKRSTKEESCRCAGDDPEHNGGIGR